MHHSFLDDPRVFSMRLACELGINESLVISQLHYWLKYSKRKHEGRFWVYNTYDQWQELLPFLSERTIRRAIERLETTGIILSKELGRKKRDRTKYYTLDYEKLEAIWSNCPDGTGQNDQMELVKMDSSLHNINHKETAKDTGVSETHAGENLMTDYKEAAKAGGVDAILKLAKEKAALEPVRVKNTVESNYNWWVKLCKFHSDDAEFMSDNLTNKLKGQVKHLMNAAGPDFVPMVYAVVRDWSTFRMRVLAIKGGVMPDQPSIPHVLIHVDLALAFAKEKVETKPNVQLSAEKSGTSGLGSGTKGWD